MAMVSYTYLACVAKCESYHRAHISLLSDNLVLI